MLGQPTRAAFSDGLSGRLPCCGQIAAALRPESRPCIGSREYRKMDAAFPKASFYQFFRPIVEEINFCYGVGPPCIRIYSHLK
ncbi:Uncharacterised protein [Bergeriella denitrificans]|uniref:Uncharacterized protein n=1 Tax=Bergeriella denitrificans TaxID=494 RepID=A0A378UFE6_BERDE|nr:Uncharacterised protein [Bergeriella denitrificans]